MAGANQESMQRVDLTTLSLPQLGQLKQQLEQVCLVSYFILIYDNWTDWWQLMCIECSFIDWNIFKDLNLYQESLQTLKIAQTKFQESAESAEKLETTKEGSVILVPLTGSVNFISVITLLNQFQVY